VNSGLTSSSISSKPSLDNSEESELSSVSKVGYSRSGHEANDWLAVEFIVKGADKSASISATETSVCVTILFFLMNCGLLAF
jgi:hypothetical protein